MPRKPRDPAWMPASYADADMEALKALSRGQADAAMQGRALKWIIETVCETYGLSFRSDGEGGDRETAFAEGKRHVGLQLVKLINMPPQIAAQMRDKNG